MKLFKRLFIIICVTFLFIPTLINAYSEQNLIKHKGTLITDIDLTRINLNLSDRETNMYSADDIREMGHNPAIGDSFNSANNIPGKQYYVKYKNAFIWKGTPVTIKITVVSAKASNYTNYSIIYDNGYVRLQNQGSSNTVKFEFLDENNNPVYFTGVLGFTDVDCAPIYFNTNRKIYYIDGVADRLNDWPSSSGQKFSNNAYIESNGIFFRTYYHVSGHYNSYPSYYGQSVYIDLKNESSFEFTIKVDDLDLGADTVSVPILYMSIEGEAQIRYIDKSDNNAVLDVKGTFFGKIGDDVLSKYTTKIDDLNNYLDSGYRLVSDDTFPSPKFTNDSKVYDIILEHTYTKVNKDTYEEGKCLNRNCTVKQPGKGC